MRQVEKVQPWVVYQTVTGKTAGMRVVCAQAEWEALQVSQPGQHKLVKQGIVSEAEADKLARGTLGDKKVRGK